MMVSSSTKEKPKDLSKLEIEIINHCEFLLLFLILLNLMLIENQPLYHVIYLLIVCKCKSWHFVG